MIFLTASFARCIKITIFFIPLYLFSYFVDDETKMVVRCLDPQTVAISLDYSTVVLGSRSAAIVHAIVGDVHALSDSRDNCRTESDIADISAQYALDTEGKRGSRGLHQILALELHV